MKYLLTFLLTLTSIAGFSQYSLYQWFESPYDAYRPNFSIDTVGNPDNQWQIGKPQKDIIAVAYSYPNAIVTDTLNPYRQNDTSVFYLKIGGAYHALLSLSFFYRLDIDSLSSSKIEISGDLGENWIDPLTEDDTYMFYWVGGKPRFDTSSYGWQSFNLNMDSWSMASEDWGPIFPHYRTSDTVIFKFTFISGNDTSHHDGWALDNFTCINSGRVAVGDVLTDAASIVPNPSNGTILLRQNFENDADDRIVIYNMQGQEVYNTTAIANMPIELPLPDGVYSTRYLRKGGTIVSKLVIVH